MAGRVVLLLALSFGLFLACKQKEGDRCQVDTDCEDGLVCAQATHTCESTVSVDGSIMPDATVDAGMGSDAAIDATQVDAPSIDASVVDASFDASPDA